MGNWPKVIALLVIISVGLGFGGYMFYRNEYVKPRQEITKKREELKAAIENGKKATENIVAMTTNLEPLYTRSFPLNNVAAAQQYEIWLSQMLEFCNMEDAKITRLRYSPNRPAGLSTQGYGVQTECNLIDLTQFLYEFYWTPFLHRISTLDITPDESSNKLRASIVIEGLTINFRTNPRQAYPLLNQLPLDANPPKQLASGPFAAYKALGDLDVFRAVRTGIDRTKLLLLSGVPTITDDSGNSVTVSRWRLESEDRVITLKVGDDLKIDSFVGTVVDIDDDFVALRQSNGLLWVVLLGRSLGDAIAIPPNLF